MIFYIQCNKYKCTLIYICIIIKNLRHFRRTKKISLLNTKYFVYRFILIERSWGYFIFRMLQIMQHNTIKIYNFHVIFITVFLFKAWRFHDFFKFTCKYCKTYKINNFIYKIYFKYKYYLTKKKRSINLEKQHFLFNRKFIFEFFTLNRQQVHFRIKLIWNILYVAISSTFFLV